MYSSEFCKVYNAFGWNYFPYAFGEQLLEWIERNGVQVKSSLDLGCGTGILCQILSDRGIEAHGMDLSEGMIAVARKNSPALSFEVANMITYRPDKSFDLVTSTGDALNHIFDLQDLERIFKNVFDYLSPGGYFIFDILNENEVTPGEPFDLDYSETIRAQFLITKDGEGVINLRTSVFENGELQFEENIFEVVHDPEMICAMLQRCGFEVIQCADSLLKDSDLHGTTWFIIAKKPL